ncbi:MAG: hypothetical protein ACTHJL_13380 [Amnibacterium sp.]
MRLNGLGVAMYLLMTGWMLLASLVRALILLEAGQLDALPFVGVGLGLLGLAGIGFGRVVDHDEPHRRARERRRAEMARAASGRGTGREN